MWAIINVCENLCDFIFRRHLKTTVGRSRGIKRFAIYSIAAWGIPFFVVFVSVLLDQLYGLYG